MKIVSLFAASLVFCVAMAAGQVKVLTNDPLTGLPLLPASESAKKTGNAPVKMPDGSVCKTKMQGNFYKVYDYFAKDNIKQADAITFYTAHLPGFKKGESSDHGMTIYSNADGTIVVIVIAQLKTSDGIARTSSVSYERYQPGISEKTIASFLQKRIVCP